MPKRTTPLERLVAARTVVINLVLEAPGFDRDRTVAFLRALERLELCTRAQQRAELNGAPLEPDPPAPAVTAAELAAVKRAILERSAELEEERRRRRGK